MARDMNGQEIHKGDVVSLPIRFGEFAPATVEDVTSALVTAGNPNGLAQISVVLRFNIQVQPNGVVPGLIKLAISGGQPTPQ